MGIRTWKLNEQQTPIMNTKSLILIFSWMLLSIGAMPQEAPPGAEEVAKTEDEAELDEDEEEDPDMTDEEIAERDGDEEDEELDEDEPEEDEAEEDEPKEEDATEDKEEEDIPEELLLNARYKGH